MRIEEELIKSTAGQVAVDLRARGIDPARPVTVMIGRPSLSIIARRLQGEAAKRGMTTEIHDELMDALKNAG